MDRANLVTQYFHGCVMPVCWLFRSCSMDQLQICQCWQIWDAILIYFVVTSGLVLSIQFLIMMCAFFDPCHMLKLVRNTLGDKKSIFDGNDSMMIATCYTDRRNRKAFTLGNGWDLLMLPGIKGKMNGHLAAQLLSDSVVTSLEFWSQEGIPYFKDCEATTKFIWLFINYLTYSTLEMLMEKNSNHHGMQEIMQKFVHSHWRLNPNSTLWH